MNKSPHRIYSVKHRLSVELVETESHEPCPGEDPAEGLLRDVALVLEREDAARGFTAQPVARDVWLGLLSGRWALLERFEHEERRFLVARHGQPTYDLVALSRRERQVVACALRGLSNKAMAFDLHLTESTVATHLRRAMSKLQIESRTELIRSIPLAEAELACALPEPTGP